MSDLFEYRPVRSSIEWPEIGRACGVRLLDVMLELDNLDGRDPAEKHWVTVGTPSVIPATGAPLLPN